MRHMISLAQWRLQQMQTPSISAAARDAVPKVQSTSCWHDLQVAYKQNHRWLAPDHGFPVRMIIPGHIGGRMVKWLEVRS